MTNRDTTASTISRNATARCMDMMGKSTRQGGYIVRNLESRSSPATFLISPANLHTWDTAENPSHKLCEKEEVRNIHHIAREH